MLAAETDLARDWSPPAEDVPFAGPHAPHWAFAYTLGRANIPARVPAGISADAAEAFRAGYAAGWHARPDAAGMISEACGREGGGR